ncbi:MAG: hypothetical protein Q4G68_11690 [Planctomycetia bacterium]|nr:hypothetical protein [Planctomycetia bacterium]
MHEGNKDRSNFNPYAPPQVEERRVARRVRKLSPRLRELYNRNMEYDLYAIAETLGKFRWYEQTCLKGIIVAGILFIFTGVFGLLGVTNKVFNTCAAVSGCLMILEFIVFMFWLYILCMPAEWRLVKRMNDLMDMHVRNFNPFAFGDNQKYLAEALIEKHGYDPGGFWSGPELSQFSHLPGGSSREHF